MGQVALSVISLPLGLLSGGTREGSSTPAVSGYDTADQSRPGNPPDPLLKRSRSAASWRADPWSSTRSSPAPTATRGQGKRRVLFLHKGVRESAHDSSPRDRSALRGAASQSSPLAVMQFNRATGQPPGLNSSSRPTPRTDRAEVEHLAHEDVDRASGTKKWQESSCGRATSLVAVLAIPGSVGCQPLHVEPKKMCLTSWGTCTNAAPVLGPRDPDVIVAGLRAGRRTVWAPPAMRWVMSALRHLPHLVFSRLPI